MKVKIAVLNEAMETLMKQIASTFTNKESKVLFGFGWALEKRAQCQAALAQFIEQKGLADAEGNIDLDRIRACLDEGLTLGGGEYTMHIDFDGLVAPQNATLDKSDFDKLFNETIPMAAKKVGC